MLERALSVASSAGAGLPNATVLCIVATPFYALLHGPRVNSKSAVWISAIPVGS